MWTYLKEATLGPAVGALIYNLGGFKLPFIVVGLVALVLAISLIFLIPSELLMNKVIHEVVKTHKTLLAGSWNL